MFAGKRRSFYGEGGITISLCVQVTYTPTVSTEMGCFDATIHEFINKRYPQSSIIATYNGFKRSL